MGEELWVRPRAWRAAPQKVANRGIGAWRSRGRERLLNDGQIQSPSVQSWLAARSQACWRGFGIFHPFKDPVSVAPCQTLISRFATFSIAGRCGCGAAESAAGSGGRGSVRATAATRACHTRGRREAALRFSPEVPTPQNAVGTAAGVQWGAGLRTPLYTATAYARGAGHCAG